MRDALRTTAVMGVILLGAVLVGQLVTVTPDRPERSVDLDTAITGAQAVATFDVVAPSELPNGWIATSARFTPDAWHLGVLTPDNTYAGLEQAALSTQGIVRDFAPKSRAAGEARLGGDTWQVRTESDGDRIYVRDFGDTAVLVIGSVKPAELERYVSSLVVVPADS